MAASARLEPVVKRYSASSASAASVALLIAALDRLKNLGITYLPKAPDGLRS